MTILHFSTVDPLLTSQTTKQNDFFFTVITPLSTVFPMFLYRLLLCFLCEIFLLFVIIIIITLVSIYCGGLDKNCPHRLIDLNYEFNSGIFILKLCCIHI